ncbi:hypothetical protein FBQ96_02370 [Nitrospirales bacterium NOB]|nr:hypothetical protein [Nitrospirota bacterium]MCK6493633.1 hypothetical protein [Nitrospira sp.]MDL1888422.1 hypothetical protein [Nitrospirales bacterium NOB]MEB2338179.1 hypothetical protein [Nitrospirales bacterium]
MAESLPNETAPTSEDDYAELRQLLLAPERSRLARLQAQVAHFDLTPANLNRVLPEAITLRGDKDLRLTQALTPHVTEALSTTVRQRPHMIVDAIAPVMMPAIRQAISTTLRSMIQSLNQTIEHSLSLRSLQWRLEAFRTGKPFAEIVLLHTLRYRVEQVFLIHAHTGLLLAHAAGDAVVVQDQTLVSGMLSAIRSFVQDSFGAAPDQALNTLHVGDLTVWIEQGDVAIVAAVIRGTPPESLRHHLQDTLARIQAEQPEALEAFSGDRAAFAGVTPLLEACLQSHFESGGRSISPMMWILPVVLLCGVAWWGVTTYQAQRQWQASLDRLKAEPGLVVTAAYPDGGRYRIEGLRDPLARDPIQVLQDQGLSSDRINFKWSAYYALEPALTLRRAQQILALPNSVRLSLEGTRLAASGTAPPDWIAQSRVTARLIPGVDAYDDSRLAHQTLEDWARRLSTERLLFLPGVSSLSPDQEPAIRRLSEQLDRLNELAQLAGKRVTVEIIGQTDVVGRLTRNRTLSALRAQTVLKSLRPEALPMITFHATGIGPGSESGQGTAAEAEPNDRRVSFHITVHPAS